MSPRTGTRSGARPGPLKGRDHERARSLASLQLDEALSASDDAWLSAHLAACADCSTVAAEYAEGRAALRGLRANPAEPPRDLWARTAAKIEAEAGRRPNRAPAPRRMFGGRLPMGALAPLTAMLVLAVAVGAGLLNGTALLPPGTAALPTPIAITAAADVQVLSRSEDGSVQILSRPVNAVCPAGSAECGLTRTFAVTNVGGVSGSDSLNAAMSPHRDRLVVVASSNGTQGVYVVPVAAPKSTPATTGTATTGTPDATGGPASVFPASPVVVATGTPATASTSPDASPAATATPTGSDASGSPAASPSIPVSPAPGGVLEIASNVVVVGPAAYSPDGTQVAFSARPADGSAGPDVYLWTTGEKVAKALTKDHAAQFASWTTAGILVSRVADATPSTTLLDPSTGAETPVAIGAAWLPTVDPTGTVGAWWSGSMKRTASGDWVPDHGSLVVGAWPRSAGAGAVPSTPEPTTTPGPTVSDSPTSASGSAPADASPSATATPDATTLPASDPDSPAATPSASAKPPHKPSAKPSASVNTDASPSPSAAPDGVQVLSRGPLSAWAVRWDETGTAMAVWTMGTDQAAAPATPAPSASAAASNAAAAGSDTVGATPSASVPTAPDAARQNVDGTPVPSAGATPAQTPAAEAPATGIPAPAPSGRLSLYRVDAATGLAELAHPMLDAVPADGGFSLRTGRLAWTAPASGEMVLQVLAWSGATIGRLELPATTGAMIVP